MRSIWLSDFGISEFAKSALVIDIRILCWHRAFV